MEWHPKNYFDLPYTSPVVVIILGANGHTGEKYAKVLCRYISNKGWKACVIIRFVFSVSIYFGGIGVLFGLLRSYKDNRRKCLIVKVAYKFWRKRLIKIQERIRGTQSQHKKIHEPWRVWRNPHLCQRSKLSF